MGQDKALLRLDDRPLLQAVAERVAEACGGVTIIGPPEVYGELGFEIIPDLRPGNGPLGGIEAALDLGRADWNVVVACDMPNLTADLVGRLVAAARETPADCVVAVSPGGRREPLCAVYRTSCLPAVRRALALGIRRVSRVLDELQVVHYQLESQEEVVNLNTPQDWLTFRGSERG
ncbi:MAG: molybdenum cofactor guanylyltransferase [Bryobacterales bacterium]|nr:molybdenum cofactor guanylyltransferase [Bryobacterales bacterium]